MEKKHFFIKLFAPRPTFAQDMTNEEREMMMRHIAYWKDLTLRRTAIVFGPVFEVDGGYGMGIVETDDEQEAQNLMQNDPTILSNRGFRFEIYPMRVGMVRN